jgi:copper homeostasis protein
MQLEICIETIASAIAAKNGGADRLEVCGSLALGGITPGLGLVERCVALGGIGVMMMVRPHSGSFCYSEDELGTMRREIQTAKELGVQGVVFGALAADGNVDREGCARLIDFARPLEATFHRAFDLSVDPMASLDDLLDLGFDRLLTSGQAKTAGEGADLIRAMVQRAGDRLSIVVGGGVRPETIGDLLSTGAREFHASARTLLPTGATDDLGLCHPPFETDSAVVARLSQVIRGH